MKVDGREVSLANYGRTRDFLFCPFVSRSDVPASCTSGVSSSILSGRTLLVEREEMRLKKTSYQYRSDLVNRRNRPCSDFNQHSETGEESPIMLLKESMSRIHSEILRTGYITANNRR